ncbi:MAG: hypothetical protein RM049_21605 [Nostoc sp. DedQUE04]|uniref:hypothetical protein n=1 Tax=Nostoc sp. DedQUE04 TaxID=3075390 RepID=UPI002AD57DD1|nr:hypothetical protein [Nostoc sp. DedQUE04]MDZ8137869.1 hypothetical protein [Nostoc sp. DedQUE04]
MSNINNHGVDMNNKQIKDFYSIEAVRDLSHEAAATISGGSQLFLGDISLKGITLKKATRSLPGFARNKASYYVVAGSGDWIVYSGKNFKGQSRRLESGTRGRLGPRLYMDIESARPVKN